MRCVHRPATHDFFIISCPSTPVAFKAKKITRFMAVFVILAKQQRLCACTDLGVEEKVIFRLECDRIAALKTYNSDVFFFFLLLSRNDRRIQNYIRTVLKYQLEPFGFDLSAFILRAPTTPGSGYRHENDKYLKY